MGILEQKNKLLNQISALKTLSDGFPSLDYETLIPNFPSLNNKSNSLDFLMDLIKTVTGAEQLKNDLIQFLTYNTNTIESTIKRTILKILKKKFSCSVDALLPSFLIDGLGNGFNVAVSQVDFFDIFKVNPQSTAGRLIYGNIDQDLNNFLYNVLQGNKGTWKNILVVEYMTSGIVDGVMKSNVFNVKISSTWTGKTVNSFINKFIDSLKVISLPILVNKLFDILYGTISAALSESISVLDQVVTNSPIMATFSQIQSHGKSTQTIESEVQLEILVNKIVDLPDTEIDNSYFEFTADDIDFFNERVDERVNGRRILKDCNFVSSSINFDDLVDTNDELESASSLVEIKTILDNKFNLLAESATSNLDSNSQKFGSLDFFEKLFKGLLQALASLLFSPKIMFLFISYFKIVSSSIGFKDFDDFLKQNKGFIVEIIKDILLPLLLEFLLKLVIKHITKLILEDQIGSFSEKVKQQQLQILSLVGIPQNIRDIIAKL